ncbi:hypothetical protein SAMN06297144_1777 [Sphingomonas guangdongensis]|uniref:Uncharacterized protein n=1 Tax=Sphingomonas guangdongensis TaxID=1141890 RepID=A0A285QZ83_9SPHN|nr:hypothetical protein [Sphingomonas guangdongensis]SOB86669.1 hypothetical protein SAMN06297144_1777 [Sphingomonas guangdongensis]
MADKAGGMNVVSNPFVADIFADEAIAFDVVNGTVRITLATMKMAEAAAPSPMHFVANGRVIMTVPGAQRLALALFDYLKKQGLDPATVVGGGDDAARN